MAGELPTVVVVDDAPEVRLLVKTRLRVSGRLRVVGEGANGADAVEMAGEHRPTLMLLDVSMPDMDGLEALPLVLAASPGTRVVLYSGFDEQGLAEQARRMGAAAFVEKSAPVGDLVQTLLGVIGEEHTAATVVPEDTGKVEQGILQAHLERFQEVFEEAAIGMATMTLTGRLVRVNKALASLLQRRPEELVGVFYGTFTGDDGRRVGAAIENIRRRRRDVVQLQHDVEADNRRVRATLAPVRDSDGRALYLFLQVQDVTSELAAVEELRQSEERFRLLVEAVEDYAIFMLDPGGHIVSWNAGAQRIKGYAAQEIIGRHFRVFYPAEVAARKHPEHELEVALREGHYQEEGWRLRKDGSRFWANVLITAVFNDAGEHIGFAKVTRDNSQRRQLEQEREQALRALQTANTDLESLNQRLQEAAQDQAKFLAVTAHELRTPIGVLGGSAETLAAHWFELSDEERTELLDAMRSSTSRLRRLLSDLLTASRLQASALDMKTEPVRAVDAVADSVATVRRTSPEAAIEVDVPEELLVSADRDRLAQALDNLIGNSLRYGAPPVLVTARTLGSEVQIRVTDQGPGVAEAVRPRLFERFATGGRKGGTGLGLFIVRELARAQGGEAFYEDPSAECPAGAFVIVLPAGRGPRDPARVHQATTTP